MIRTREVVLFTMALYLVAGGVAVAETRIEDHRVEVRIDRRIRIVPPVKETRAMLGMVRHPDGTIFLNTQRQGLYKSVDDGQTWTASPVKFSDGLINQRLHGLGVSSDGKLWLLHQYQGNELYVSNSADGGQTWNTASVAFRNMAPGAPQRPYSTAYNDYNCFVEGSDGTMMVAVELRYSNEEVLGYQMADQSIPGHHETMIRTTDGGKTWGDPTSVHQHVAETSFSVNPGDAEHILAFTRIQRGLLPGEDEATVMEITGAPDSWRVKGHTATSVYKNGILLESTDGGRSFSEPAGGLVGFYEHRGVIFWASNDVIVIVHNGGIHDYTAQARISRDGGTTWVDGTKKGTPLLNKSKEFELVPAPPSHSYMTPTVELSPNHFLTTYAHVDAKSTGTAISGVFWHLEPASEN